MAESSIFWTTGSTGDGATPYTQAQIIDWLRRTFVNAPASEGVLIGYANALAPSGTTSPVAVATGAAMVYGFPYENTASVSVAITTPTLGTTGHRIVLRADWTAQTVRIALKSSSDGVASIPALTQSENTTWEISLATLTITTGGAITLTDTRSYLHPNVKAATGNIDDLAVTTGKIADDAVTQAKIGAGAVGTTEIADNAVDDTKAGSRMPQFYRRQGGDATNWSTPGSSNYTPGAVRMQAGVAVVYVANGYQYGSVAVTFPTAFSAPPLVFFGDMTDVDYSIGDAHPQANDVTASGMNLYLARTGTTGAIENTISWLAIGPE